MSFLHVTSKTIEVNKYFCVELKIHWGYYVMDWQDSTVLQFQSSHTDLKIESFETMVFDSCEGRGKPTKDNIIICTPILALEYRQEILKRRFVGRIYVVGRSGVGPARNDQRLSGPGLKSRSTCPLRGQLPLTDNHSSSPHMCLLS